MNSVRNDLTLLSPCLREMIATGIGYRNNQYSSGIIDLKKIIDYEFNILGNTDIFEFIKENYTHEDYDEKDSDLIDKTIDAIRMRLAVDQTHQINAVWLTDYQNVLDKYCDVHELKDIVRVYIHDHKMIPISDLGYDGALFATSLPNITYER